jgi:hypothetical protein
MKELEKEAELRKICTNQSPRSNVTKLILIQRTSKFHED